MSVARGPEGLRHFGKSDLIRVIEVATRKQWEAEEAMKATRGVDARWVVLAFLVGLAIGLFW